MSVNAYLIKEINVKTRNDELVIEKILDKDPSFTLNNEKIFNLVDNEDNNLNGDLCGEIIIDKSFWQNKLRNIVTDEYSLTEKSIIKRISDDLNNDDVIFYECF